MNGKRAKAMRQLARQITKPKGLPERASRFVGANQAGSQIVNAADSTRGQYLAIKSMVRQAYRGQS